MGTIYFQIKQGPRRNPYLSINPDYATRDYSIFKL